MVQAAAAADRKLAEEALERSAAEGTAEAMALGTRVQPFPSSGLPQRGLTATPLHPAQTRGDGGGASSLALTASTASAASSLTSASTHSEEMSGEEEMRRRKQLGLGGLVPALWATFPLNINFPFEQFFRDYPVGDPVVIRGFFSDLINEKVEVRWRCTEAWRWVNVHKNCHIVILSEMNRGW